MGTSMSFWAQFESEYMHDSTCFWSEPKRPQIRGKQLSLCVSIYVIDWAPGDKMAVMAIIGNTVMMCKESEIWISLSHSCTERGLLQLHG